jgi:AcrR family transcriptional regulator
MADRTAKEEVIHKQVIKAAQKLYQQHGLFKVTMEDVAKAVGKGKSTLYYYYKSKEEIFASVIKAELAEIFSEVAVAVDAVNSTEEKIKAYCLARLDLSKRKKTSFDTMDMNAAQGELSSFKGIIELTKAGFREQEHDAFRKIILMGINNSEVRKMNDQEIDLIVFVTMSSFRGMKQELIEKNNVSLDQKAAETIASLVMNGLRE